MDDERIATRWFTAKEIERELVSKIQMRKQ
jgi:hypothetical protein